MHGDDNDLRALRWIHRRVIDTGELETRYRNALKNRQLKTLSRLRLERTIQDDPRGHDSVEVAQVIRDLARWYMANLPLAMNRKVARWPSHKEELEEPRDLGAGWAAEIVAKRDDDR
ncbi:hypothetical protein N7532_012039 [Penicillium argentinense]|uniref:Uncharacterized protein n=1 Tax=Penicillium argentinense TaxID=1131581 RepID=A0A9W9JVK7_9EURO|nr:uncharacterized protein N7532_012039 [Penicillium argentinense]KAJ5082996.1 hypothetical protein N7532_012039 [Penicillium argentinense]